jgi:hypothetical protein
LNRRPYAFYDFGNYLGVSNLWHASRNFVFNFGNVEIWNARHLPQFLEVKIQLEHPG